LSILPVPGLVLVPAVHSHAELRDGRPVRRIAQLGVIRQVPHDDHLRLACHLHHHLALSAPRPLGSRGGVRVSRRAYDHLEPEHRGVTSRCGTLVGYTSPRAVHSPGKEARAMTVTVHALRAKKSEGRRWAMLTAYDFPTAQILDEAGIPVLLVGDSVADNILG